MMLTISSVAAVVFFLFWLIEHIGGRQIRDDLRLRLMIARHERDVARTTRKVADVIEFPAGGRG